MFIILTGGTELTRPFIDVTDHPKILHFPFHECPSFNIQKRGILDNRSKSYILRGANNYSRKSETLELTWRSWHNFTFQILFLLEERCW